MQNKANFLYFSPKNAEFTKKQTQFKPNKAKNKPNLTQYKANSNPICRKGNNESSCVENEPYDHFNSLTRGSYHPKGCQFQSQTNPISKKFRSPESPNEKKQDILDDLVDNLISDLRKNLSDFI